MKRSAPYTQLLGCNKMVCAVAGCGASANLRPLRRMGVTLAYLHFVCLPLCPWGALVTNTQSLRKGLTTFCIAPLCTH